jgi:hypothetical protein
MKQYLMSLLFLLWSIAVCADDRSLACFKEIELDFFREDIVSQALSLHGVSQTNWKNINNNLRERARHVPRILRQKAEYMHPNPFQSPFQTRVAAQLLRQTLYEIFAATLKDNNITNESNIKDMFRYIREKQAHRLIACFGEEEMEEEF